MEKLYKNIGKKIKDLAVWFFLTQALLMVFASIVLLVISTNKYLVIASILMLVISPIIAWVASWLLYGAGELIDKTQENERNTRKIVKLLNQINERELENMNEQTKREVEAFVSGEVE